MTATLTLASMLRNTVDRHPDNEALVSGERRWTYAEWDCRINRAAHALRRLGLGRGDRVALFQHTDEPLVTLFFACQKIGAVPVPLNFRLAAAEVAHVLCDSGAHVLACSQDLLDTVTGAMELARVSPRLVVVHPPEGKDGGPGWDDHGCCPINPSNALDPVTPQHDYEELLATANETDPGVDACPNDLCALIYTSGTTGRAKGVMHSHENDIAIAFNCATEYHLRTSDRALHIAPLYHVGGMQAFLIPHLLMGATNVIGSRRIGVDTMQVLRRERITTLFAVPVQLQQLLDHPDFGSAGLSTLRLITTGGAALPAAMAARVLAELCPGLFQGYGLTEASLALLLRPCDALIKHGSVGKSTVISQTRIVSYSPNRDVDPEDVVGVGDVGQLIIRGPQVTRGYWNNPDETARRWLYDGWLCTGDLFSRDADGYHYFHGRADDMIVSGGENIYPSEIEEVLHCCPGVAAAAVVGLPDEQWGTMIAAFVVASDPTLTSETVDLFCRNSGMLAAFKRPRRIEFLDTLPTNPSGKILRRTLITAYRESVDRIPEEPAATGPTEGATPQAIRAERSRDSPIPGRPSMA